MLKVRKWALVLFRIYWYSTKTSRKYEICISVVLYVLVLIGMHCSWSETNKRRRMSNAAGQKWGKEMEWALASIKNQWKRWVEHFYYRISVGVE